MDRRVRKDTHHDCLFGLYELCGGSRGGEVGATFRFSRDSLVILARVDLALEDLHNFTI